MGDGSNSLPLEDEETGNTLYASPQMNPEFMFIFGNIIKKVGYFDERFVNTRDLDVLDYIIKLRKAGLYPPENYNITIGNGMKKNFNKINKNWFYYDKNYLKLFKIIIFNIPNQRTFKKL